MRTSQNAHGTLSGFRWAFWSAESFCVGVLSSACDLRAPHCPLAFSSPRESSSREFHFLVQIRTLVRIRTRCKVWR